MKGNEGDAASGKSYSHEVQRVFGLRLLLGDHGPADGHNGGDNAIDALGGLALEGLRLPAIGLEYGEI